MATGYGAAQGEGGVPGCGGKRVSGGVEEKEFPEEERVLGTTEGIREGFLSLLCFRIAGFAGSNRLYGWAHVVSSGGQALARTRPLESLAVAGKVGRLGAAWTPLTSGSEVSVAGVEEQTMGKRVELLEGSRRQVGRPWGAMEAGAC